MHHTRLFILSLSFLFLLANTSDGQSRRPLPNPTPERINKRPATTEPAPTPPIDEKTDLAAEEAEKVIRVETRLVSFPVRVVDRRGRFVGGLTSDNFKVFENNVEQTIEYFQSEAAPFTVVLMLDVSYSTVFKIEEIQSAAIAFIDQLRPDDRVAVVSFDGEVHFLCDATHDRSVIFSAIRRTRISTGTSLYEAIDLVINRELAAIDGRKAVVLFTDGVDTTSRESNDLANLRDVSESDVLIYPIRYDTFADVQSMRNKPIVNRPDIRDTKTPPTVPSEGSGLPFPLPGPVVSRPSETGTRPEDYRFAEEFLDRLAERSGGRVFVANTFGNLAKAFETIASELREYYRIGYYPTEDARPGSERRIRIRVDRENVAVKARTTYSIPER